MENVWAVRNRHAVPDLPQHYVFFLRCCQSSDCQHPFCKQGVQLPSWFPGGPSVRCFLMPVPDPSASQGRTDCCKCQGRICYGHFLSPESCLKSTAVPMTKPPSQILKQAFIDLKGKEPSETDVEKMSKATLLPPGEVKIWLDHLQTIQTNRKRGAEKAAATRCLKKKQSQPRYMCVCGEEYVECTDQIQYWIGCDACDHWYHCECVDVDPHSVPENFVCPECTH